MVRAVRLIAVILACASACGQSGKRVAPPPPTTTKVVTLAPAPVEPRQISDSTPTSAMMEVDAPKTTEPREVAATFEASSESTKDPARPAWGASELWCPGTGGTESEASLTVTFAEPQLVDVMRFTIVTDGRQIPRALTLTVDDGRTGSYLVAQGTTHIKVSSRLRSFSIHVPSSVCVGVTPIIAESDARVPLLLVPGVPPDALGKLPAAISALGSGIPSCNLSAIADHPFHLTSRIRPGGAGEITLDGDALTAECRAGGLPPLVRPRHAVAAPGTIALVTDGDFGDSAYQLAWRDGAWHATRAIDHRILTEAAVASVSAEWRATLARWLAGAVYMHVDSPALQKTILTGTPKSWCTQRAFEVTFPRGAFLDTVELETAPTTLPVELTVDGAPAKLAPFYDGTQFEAKLDGRFVTKLRFTATKLCVQGLRVQLRETNFPAQIFDLPDERLLAVPAAVHAMDVESCDRARIAAVYKLPYQQTMSGEDPVRCGSVDCIVKMCRAGELKQLTESAAQGGELYRGTATTLSVGGSTPYGGSIDWDLVWDGTWKIQGTHESAHDE